MDGGDDKRDGQEGHVGVGEDAFDFVRVFLGEPQAFHRVKGGGKRQKDAQLAPGDRPEINSTTLEFGLDANV